MNCTFMFETGVVMGSVASEVPLLGVCGACSGLQSAGGATAGGACCPHAMSAHDMTQNVRTDER